ncbi:MAG: hypothetical protein M5R36_14620 [Deltaproteobacteria bacterium]|nr:hypothetical protein [Deltaproteobacteria bacterium]
MKRHLKISAVVIVAVAVVIGALSLIWQFGFVLPRVERFPDPVAIAKANGPASTDYHYAVAVDLVGALPDVEFSTPKLAEAAQQLAGRADARPDPRTPHPLARLVTLGSSSNYRDARRAIHLPAPASVTYRIHVPTGGALRADVGLLPGATGPVRFVCRVNGNEAASLTVNPLPPFPYDESGWFYENVYRRWNIALEPRDERWLPFEADLSAWRDTDVVLELSAESDQPAQAFLGAPAVLERRSGPAHPVIVYIADGCNTRYLGAYGNGAGITPNIDAFAARGQPSKPSSRPPTGRGRGS